ncbi:MAG: CdaR family protein [Anaerolineales bacterium]
MRLLRWLWENISSLLLALVLALTVWVAAVSAEDPVQERTMATAVPIELRNVPSGLMIVQKPAVSTRVTLRAPQSVWDNLSAADLEVWADLSGAQAGLVRLDLHSKIDIRPVEITHLEPSTISLRLEPTASKEFSIELNSIGEPAVGYRANEAVIDPTTAVVSGPSPAVGQVDRVIAQLDLSGRSQDINEVLTLQPVDSNGDVVSGVSLKPDQVQVEAKIEDLGGYRSVVVSPKIEGEVEPGYQLTRITVTPTLVRVFSPDPRVVNGLSGFVETEPVSLAGATEDFDRRVALNLPEGVSIVGEQSVVVQVSITPIENSITITRLVEFQGLAPGLYAQASPETVNLILNGPLPVLDNLTSDDVRVVLDLGSLGQGTHQLTPNVIAASPQIRVQSILPDTIEVTITDVPPPTPTPTLVP